MSLGKIIALCFAGLLGLFALTWAIQGNQFFLYKVFAPKEEQVRRETFEQSRAYNAGTIQQLRSAQREYIQAPADRRAGLGSVIIQQFADYPDESLPADLRSFMSCLRQHQVDGFDCSPGAGQ